MTTRLDRRSFVLASLGTVGALAQPLGARAAPHPGTLVLLQLSGGNDGFSTLVPHSDDAYGRARRFTRIDAESVRRIDERVGLHPRLAGLHALYGRGNLALIEGVGYPRPNRSHFRSLDIWHAADARGRGAGSGWIGRAVERLEAPPPHAVVHLGSRAPFALHSARRPPLCLQPALLRLTDPEHSRAQQAARALEVDGSSGEGAELALVRTVLREAQASTAILRTALARGSTGVSYPSSSLGQDLRSAAALIHAEVGVRVCSLELDGFDTHAAQRDKHDDLMRKLDQALTAFTADLGQSEAGRATLVLLFSEFGRRLAENASGGTDHGAAGLALALGPRVRGGLYGRPPALDALEDGDPVFTTDFRALYATAVGHAFALDPAAILGPGFAPLAIV